MRVAFATTGSIPVATGATGWVTSSDSSPLPRREPSKASHPSRQAPGVVVGPSTRAPGRASGAARERPPRPSAPIPSTRSATTSTCPSPRPSSGPSTRSDDPDEALETAVRTVRDAYGHHLVAIWEARGDRLVPRAVASADVAGPFRLADVPTRYGILGRTLALAADRPQASRAPQPAILLDEPDGTPTILPDGRPELAIAIPGGREPWGALLIVGETPGSLGARDMDVGRVVAEAVGALLIGAHRADEVAHLLHRAEALSRVASDIGSRLDLDRILSGLVDHAMVLFEGDRGAVLLLQAGRSRGRRGQPWPVVRLHRPDP